MAFKKLIIFTLLFSVGTAFAVPTEITDRVEYSRALNSVATIIMNWYGQLIEDTEHVNFADLEPIINSTKANHYRSKYPKHITQIVITNTTLLKLGNNYQFNIDLIMNYKKNYKQYTQKRSETFVFSNLLSSHPKIELSQLDSQKEIDFRSIKAYTRQHYKLRKFVYAWLSYLDGVDTFKPVMNAHTWFEKVIYSLNMGELQLSGSLEEVLSKRKDTLFKGGHLLRSLKVRKRKGSKNHFILDLIIEWKGKNAQGKVVSARIQQALTVHIKKDKSWEVITIQEKHLLPIIAPWMGMLC